MKNSLIKKDWKAFLETVKAAGYKITFSVAKNVRKAVEAKNAKFY